MAVGAVSFVVSVVVGVLPGLESLDMTAVAREEICVLDWMCRVVRAWDWERVVGSNSAIFFNFVFSFAWIFFFFFDRVA